MSLRKAKKLLEHKKVVDTNANQIDEQSQEEMPKTSKTNMFTAFGDKSDSDDDSETKQKEEQVQMPKNQPQKKKKKNKKKKKKPEEEENLEQIFKEVGLQYKKEESAKEANKQEEEWETILSIHENRFNYEKQLRRHFGGAQVQDRDDDPQLTKKQQKMQKHLRKLVKKSTLSPGIKQYIPIHEKFDIDRDEDKVRFIPTKKYDHYQVQYEAIRNSNDINALIMFSQTHPEHVDSLYYIGEFLRLQGNYRDADNLIQKVIYIYEAAGGYDLTEFIKSDFVKKQIVYDVYSTSLFMALFKFMDILGKKGCFKAALEYNKFLLKINLNDPTACLLCLDYNAISSKSYSFLLSFVKNYAKYTGQQDSTLYLMPNFIYSVALAKFNLENMTNADKEQLVLEQNNINKLIQFDNSHWQKALHLAFKDGLQNFSSENSQVLILRAILLYPNLIFQIAQKNQYAKQFMNHPSFVGHQQKPFKDILKHQFWEIVPSSYSYYFLKLENVNDSNGFDKVLEVYVERSKILWKSKEIMLWMKGALGFVLNKIDQGTFSYQNFLEKLCLLNEQESVTIPFNLGRYSNVSKANFSDRVEQIDLANIQDNQQHNIPQNQNRMNLQGNAFSLFLNSLLPWVNLPAQRQQQFDPDMPDIQDD